MNYWNDDTETEALPYVEQLVLQLKAENDNLMRQRAQLREALRYAVDNPEFDSLEFDAIARAALKATENTP